MYDMELQEKEMPTPMTIEMENEMNKDEIEAALNKLEEPLWLNGGRSVPLIIRELLGVKHYETIRAALQSAQVKAETVDLETLKRVHPIRDRANGVYSSASYEVDGYNRAIDEIKFKYGDLYVEVK